MKDFDLRRAAKILAMAKEVGDDAAAAHHNVTTRTIRNYRTRLGSDAQMAAAWKMQVAGGGWHEARRKALRVAFERGIELCKVETNLKNISEFMSKAADIEGAYAMGLGGMTESPEDVEIQVRIASDQPGVELDVDCQPIYAEQAPRENQRRVDSGPGEETPAEETDS